jgi:hypothetical protein
LPRIVEQLEADGYRFVLVSDYIGTPKPHAPAPEPQATVVSLQDMVAKWVSRAPMAALTSGVN